MSGFGSETLTRATDICKRGWRIHFRGGPLLWLASRGWVLAGGLSFLPCGFICVSEWVFSQNGCWLPTEQVIQDCKVKQQVFYDLASEPHAFILNILLATHVSHIWCGRGLHSVLIPGGKNHWSPLWRLASTKPYMIVPLVSGVFHSVFSPSVS